MSTKHEEKGALALSAEDPCMGINLNIIFEDISCLFPDGLNKALNLSLLSF